MRKLIKFIVLDVETAGGLGNPLVYDIGFKIVDFEGNVYARFSIVVRNIYVGQKDLMQSAYYADKLPLYEIKLASGERVMMSFYEVRKLIHDLMAEFNAHIVYAYNLNFDKRALNNTFRFLTEGKYRYFFPKDTEFRDIYHMACQVVMATKSYINFCLKHNLLTDKGNISTTAESCYKFITKNLDFEEAHEGLDDVDIEFEILQFCRAKHKKMDTTPKNAWYLVRRKAKEMGAIA